ncbi:MAG: toxin HicA [Planctomycetota bacterium]
MKDIPQILEELRASKNIRFSRLLSICTTYFGTSRIAGSHHIFRTPWPGNPRINLQKDKSGKAKPYQIQQVIRALEHLMEVTSHEEDETEET